MKTQLLVGAIAVLAAVGGSIYQGIMVDRWGDLQPTEELKSFAERLDGVPRQIGAWESADVKVDEDEFEASGCNGVVSRLYRHATTGQEVSVYLVSGKGYHITIHSPDWCYVAAGYEMQKNPKNYSFTCPPVTQDPDFLTAVFHRETPTETDRLRILWSYTEDGRWTAPKLAEQLYARKPAMYKIYLITALGETAPPLAEDPAVVFAKEFIPTVNDVLFPKSPASVAGEANEVAAR